MTCERHGNFSNIRARANRLILSRLEPRQRIGDHAIDVLADEIHDPVIGDCIDCWRDISVYVAALAAEHLVEAHGEEGAVEITEDRIARALDQSGS